MEAVKRSLDEWKAGSLDGSPYEHPNIQTSKHPQEPLRLLEIEKELAGPEKEAALARCDAVLVALEKRIESAMREGLPPDEYPAVEALKEANTLARKILRLTVRVDGEARKA